MGIEVDIAALISLTTGIDAPMPKKFAVSGGATGFAQTGAYPFRLAEAVSQVPAPVFQL